MASAETSHQLLYKLCQQGDVQEVKMSLERIDAVLSSTQRTPVCSHSIDTFCKKGVLCASSLTTYTIAAAEGGNSELFAILWDEYLTPRGIREIPWQALRTAAYQGNVLLARVFWSREENCFNRTEPPGPRGPPRGTGNNQLKVAMRRDNFDYVDFMLAHGCDMSGLSRQSDLLAKIVNCAVDDSMTIKRIEFLASRGADFRHSNALHAAVEASSRDLAICLLDNGADPTDRDSTNTTALDIAAIKGDNQMVETLMGHGSKAAFRKATIDSAVDAATKGNRPETVLFLQTRRSEQNPTMT